MPDSVSTVRPGVYENWHQWQRVQHGAGCLVSLASELGRLGIRRPFLVTTRSLVQHPLLDTVRNAAGVAFVGQFSDAHPHTPRAVVLAAASKAREARPDGIVSFGGSTVVDTAKGIAFALSGDIAALSDFDAYTQEAGHDNHLPRQPLPHIALPTTLSGAEYSRDIGITNEQLRKKELFRYDAVTPQSVLLDPQLTTATPHRLWAATGIKVMSDAIEQLYSLSSHPVIDSLCHAAIRAFSDYLPASLDSGGMANVDARLRCQIAAWETLFGMHNAGTRVGIGGALRHQLGGMFRIPHGEATCVMLPHLLRFNFPAIPDRYRALAEALRVDAPGLDDDARLQAVVARVDTLVDSLGLPRRLEPLGVRRADLPAMAKNVIHESSLAFNPRKIDDEMQLIHLLEAAL